MKATGIVRRIDDLGRVVIPKEIRRTMRIREGDPLEIYTDRDGEVIFKKYSPMGELASFAGQLCETLNKTTGYPAVITDRDTVIAAAGAPRREVLDKRISEDIEHVMENRRDLPFKSAGTQTPRLRRLRQILRRYRSAHHFRGRHFGLRRFSVERRHGTAR